MSDAVYTVFHEGGGYCNSSEHVWVSDRTLKYNDEVIAWHDGNPGYFYVQIPKVNAQIMRVLRKIMPESCKSFMFTEGTIYKIYLSGTIESSDLTFGDMNGIF